MKTFPIYQAMIIAVLIAAILCVMSQLPIFAGKSNGEANQPETETSGQKGHAIRVEPEFRFSSQPESITLKGLNNEVLYHCADFDENHEHSEYPGITIPRDGNDVSKIQLIVKWKSEPKPYHFFTMEFYGHETAKFGTGVSGDIYQDLILEW